MVKKTPSSIITMSVTCAPTAPPRRSPRGLATTDTSARHLPRQTLPRGTHIRRAALVARAQCAAADCCAPQHPRRVARGGSIRARTRIVPLAQGEETRPLRSCQAFVCELGRAPWAHTPVAGGGPRAICASGRNSQGVHGRRPRLAPRLCASRACHIQDQPEGPVGSLCRGRLPHEA